MESKPPRLARRLLLTFLRDDLAEEVTGDLEENFKKQKSRFRARVNYWYQVINYIRPFAMRKRKFHPVTHIDMLKNYFTIGWRNLIKHRMYSAINIGGFALGIASCLLLSLYIRGELSYDSYYSNTDQIYRVVRVAKWEGEEGKGIHFPHPFADVLASTFPEIERVGQLNPSPGFGTGSAQIRRTDRTENTYDAGLVVMDQGLVEILELPFVAGNPLKALTEPNSMIITREKAQKYFGDEDPIGQSLIVNDEPSRVYNITGVIENFRPDSHLNYSFIITPEGREFWKDERTSWCCSNWHNYIMVREGTDVKALEKKLMVIVDDYIFPEAMKDKPEQTELEWLKSFHFELQPVTDIYLNLFNVHDDLSHGDIRFIWLFGSIAVFILILACINFVNLSTARSASRAKEVGIRKTVGSARSALIRQFLTESYLFSFIAIVLGVMIALLLLPSFNNLTGKSLTFPWEQWWALPALFAISLGVGILAGIYPSLYLSSFRPAKVLKGNLSSGQYKTVLRSALVIFQFTISTVLITGTLVVNRQMDYVLNKKLGFEKDHVLILDGTLTLGDKAIPLKNELAQLPDVEAVSITGYLPLESSMRNGGPHWLDGANKDHGVSSQQWSVDHDYVKAMGLKLVQGRDFSPKINSDSQAMIVNQTLATSLGLKNPVGENIHNFYGTFRVIGVVEDFHWQSMTQNISPVALMIRHDRRAMIVKVRSDDMTSSIEAITATWKKFSPHQPIRINFLDDQYARTYDDVKRFRTVLTVFTTLAIVVACLGLFALSSFMIQQRGKEISIRMVLGAPVSNILRLLSQNFVMLVGIACLIATPISWFMMDRWLQDYAYKIDITWDVFAVTGISAVTIALLTIGFQSLKASLTNPVANLKSE